MATGMQLAQIQELDIEKRCRVSLQLANSQRQNILDQDEEGAFIVAAKSGDGHAFEILIQRQQRRVLAVARRFTPIREYESNIVQHILQQAFAHLHKLKWKFRVSTYLTAMTTIES